MRKYIIDGNEGLKLMTDCAGWFGSNTELFYFIRWLAGRCKAPTLSANVKLEAAADFLCKYFDFKGFNFYKEKMSEKDKKC